MDSAILDEGLLDRVQVTAIGEAFHRDNFRFVGAWSGYHACHYSCAVQVNRAGSALTFSAAFLGADQASFFAQQP